MRRRILRAAAVVLALLPASVPDRAAAQLSARPLGMGLAYTALARGIHAADWNPANLGLPDNPGFSLSIVSVGAGVGNNSFSIDDYNRFATDPYWDSSEISGILSAIPKGGFGADAVAEARMLSFSAGRFAFSVSVRAAGSATADKTLFELPLLGTEAGKVYRFDDMDGGSLGAGSVKVSYAWPMAVGFARHFALGVSAHYDFGFGYARVDESKFALTIGTYGFGVDSRIESTVAPKGGGWGLDLGAAAQFDRRWTVSLGLLDAAGSIRWSGDVKRYTAFIRGDSLGVLDIARDEEDREHAVSDSSWEAAAADFSSRTAPVLHLGALYREGETCMTADLTQGFSRGAWTTTTPRLSLGTEWRRVRWLPLRGGMVLGGRIGFGTSIGFGIRLGKFAFDVGFMNRGFLWPSSSKGLTAAVELGAGL
jgi:hypothetical protein